jgi:leucyl/phenylalanyl-tRNA--protein transferase
MRLPHRPPLFLGKDAPLRFPDPRAFDREGLVAIGADLSVDRLLLAYRSGIFPWYAEGIVPLWWSPDPRALITPDSLHESHSLRRRIRRGGFALSWNQRFRDVMLACGRDRSEGTWVIPEMVAAYVRLHRRGHAHSLEVTASGELAAGIYGVQAGALFAAESMFHRRTDLSKVALVTLVRSLFAAGIELFDVQFVTKHLASMGAYSVPRTDYLRQLQTARDKTVDLRSLTLHTD